ncbi:cystinosin isoform X2 [Patella vulgata]|uniref:cystinosin isoform X2 n=1 Tax=Patella vulgata TaxID=6465 RepID=UPI002180633D|nr:cystinosin isoform X2 [Patella vulgata]
MEFGRRRIALLPVLLLSVLTVNGAYLNMSDSSISIELNEEKILDLIPRSELDESALIVFTYEIGSEIKFEQDTKLIRDVPNVTIPANSTEKVPFLVKSESPGHVILGINSTSTELQDLKDVYVRIDVYHSTMLVVINSVIGWIYFVAWSVSFYPQVYSNFKRKSVIGLNFDYLTYNILGFLAYGFFNVGMFWLPSIKNEYANDHPRGINPVQLNDVIFTIHAVFITIITISQCFIYERDDQKISKICKVLVGIAILFSVVTLFVAVGGKITWLTYLYYFSYIKLGVTLIKYVPQAYMNYTRKSTDGWSIGNVLLDCTGGSLSLLQMFLLSYNSNDWASIFGDPTKFGLGFFSILFDILFMVQHYILYRGNSFYTPIPDKVKPDDSDIQQKGISTGRNQHLMSSNSSDSK